MDLARLTSSLPERGKSMTNWFQTLGLNIAPLILSLKIAAIATAITFVLGLFAGYNIRRLKYGKSFFDALFTLPMVLPPTVVGFLLLILFGLNSPLGQWLKQLHIQIVFTWIGAVIASTVVAFPLMYRTARGAFEQLDQQLIDTGRTLGLSEWTIFWRIAFPNCLPGIIGGTILSFARSLGEFGATIMIAGNIPNKTQTISVAVYSAMQAGNRALAYKWVAVILVISFSAIIAMNYVNHRQLNTTRH